MPCRRRESDRIAGSEDFEVRCHLFHHVGGRRVWATGDVDTRDAAQKGKRGGAGFALSFTLASLSLPFWVRRSLSISASLFLLLW